MKQHGFVYLVGAGPGDPGLISVKGKECIEKADCIIYDYLANPVLLQHTRAELIYVGKQGSQHTLSQEEINRLIVQKVREGKVVVRLKGGDPFIFGRGGEEAEELIAAGIAYAIVPGISSFYSALAYAGIPITHRDYAASFEVITGHRRADGTEDITLPDYSQQKTYTFLMGMKNLDTICKRLIQEKNFPAQTPIAVVTWGTLPKQKVATGTLETIASEVEKAGLTPPAIIAIGRVVSLRNTLRWYDTLPLFGKKVVVTRTREQASVLSRRLYELGADVVEFPTIAITKLPELSPLHNALNRLHDYDWIVFTSQNAVSIFFEELFALGLDARSLRCKVAAIGPATRDALRAYAVVADLMPQEYVAESLVDAFKGVDIEGKKILVPCSVKARAALTQGLQQAGAQVERVHIYDATRPEVTPAMLQQVQNADIITFTSSSTVRNFVELAGTTTATVACIGPITADECIKQGLSPHIIAKEYTIEGLVQAILEYFTG
ncbi:MAG TPA: uroporphyrinogen-III C-methyltransferase [Spirochaetota bacterium]|nr:uroporphyrinogen-III C-methyltransferase [Spirochaetota bacterium]HOM10465.1 uroporphyrinogen-III C-methyltransferase [Spirochaetota bacterium]HPP50251.1 uroporphyrinogen-III C-methyltransferase [Spirochaetota bacterium]